MHQMNMSFFFFFFFFFFKNTNHQRTRETGPVTDEKQKRKILHESKHLLNTYGTKTDAGREKHQTVTFKSHQRSIYL